MPTNPYGPGTIEWAEFEQAHRIAASNNGSPRRGGGVDHRGMGAGASPDDAGRRRQGYAAGGFADLSQDRIAGLSREAQAERDYLRRLASGQDSISAEQLRQSAGTLYGQQRSFAASASPSMAPMAARTAMMNAGRIGQGMAGQQALAGIAERQAAHQSLGNMIMGERGQDMTGTLGSRNTAVNAFSPAPKPQGVSDTDRYINAAIGAGTIAAMASDRNLKTNIAPGNVDAEKFLTQLKPYTYEYKNPNDAVRFDVVPDEGASLAVPPRPAFRLERQPNPGFRVVGGDAPGGVGINGTRPTDRGLHRVSYPALSVGGPPKPHFEPVGQRYKVNQIDDNGRRMGIMAQDLEKTGSKAVIDTPRGKMVDGARLASETASVLPVLNDKIKELEKKVGKAKPKKKPKKKRTAAAVESDEGDEY